MVFEELVDPAEMDTLYRNFVYVSFISRQIFAHPTTCKCIGVFFSNYKSILARKGSSTQTLGTFTYNKICCEWENIQEKIV